MTPSAARTCWVLSAVTALVLMSAGPLLASPLDGIEHSSLDPVAEAVTPVLEDAGEALAPVTGPATDVLTPVTEAVGKALRPVTEPAGEALAPITEPLSMPEPSVGAPAVPTEPTSPLPEVPSMVAEELPVDPLGGGTANPPPSTGEAQVGDTLPVPAQAPRNPPDGGLPDGLAPRGTVTSTPGLADPATNPPATRVLPPPPARSVDLPAFAPATGRSVRPAPVERLVSATTAGARAAAGIASKAVRQFPLPVALLVLVGGGLLLQDRLDQHDPKVARIAEEEHELEFR